MKIMVLDVGGTAIKSAVFDSARSGPAASGLEVSGLGTSVSAASGPAAPGSEASASEKTGSEENGALLDIRETPTEAFRGGEHVVKKILSIIRETGKNQEFAAVGISTAGQVDPGTGTIIYANQNIPGYTGTPLAKLVSAEFSLPVRVENDVNAAALGEALFGAGKGISDFICLTYGTGIGGALFLNGRLFHGSTFSAGAAGAIVVHPEDRDPGKDMYLGGYEKYASATALVKKAQLLDPSLTDGRSIFRRLQEPQVKELVDGWIMEIVYGLVSIVHFMNPSCLILGGGIMEQPYVTDRVRETLLENIMPDFRSLEVRRAALGNRAGLLGAAALFRDPDTI